MLGCGRKGLATPPVIRDSNPTDPLCVHLNRIVFLCTLMPPGAQSCWGGSRHCAAITFRVLSENVYLPLAENQPRVSVEVAPMTIRNSTELLAKCFVSESALNLTGSADPVRDGRGMVRLEVPLSPLLNLS
jgi:hypothetical protein